MWKEPGQSWHSSHHFDEDDGYVGVVPWVGWKTQDAHLPPLGSGGNKRWKCCHWTSRDCAIENSRQLLHSDLDASCFHMLIQVSLDTQVDPFWDDISNKMENDSCRNQKADFWLHCTVPRENQRSLDVSYKYFCVIQGILKGRQILQDIVR